jgi:archaemetzincin
VRCRAGGGLALAAALLALAAQAAPWTVALQPLGDSIGDQDVAAVSQALKAMYGLEVRVLPRTPLPPEAWYAPRSRYRAERLLHFLAGRRPPDTARILGLTAEDISTTKGDVYDWGVLGLGDLDGPAGVLSLFRCKKGARSAAHARERLAKVAVHELGHALGLAHCPHSGCLMRDAEGKVSSTDEENDFCAACRIQLRAHGWALPDNPALPWSAHPAP